MTTALYTMGAIALILIGAIPISAGILILIDRWF